MPVSTASQILHRWLVQRGASPAITWYGAAGSRVELSGASTANAVFKAVNLFRDELLLPPGQTVWLDLPCHWQAPVLAMASWAAGLTVAVGPSPPVDAAVTLGTGTGAAVGLALAVTLHPWGLPLGPATPSGWQDYAALARSQPDRAALHWLQPGETWLLDASVARSGQGLRQRAEQLAASWALPAAGALLSQLPPGSETGLLAATLVPATVGGSVILTTSEEIGRISRQEGNAATARDV